MNCFISSIFNVTDYTDIGNYILNGLPDTSHQTASSYNIQLFISDFVKKFQFRYDGYYPLYTDKSIPLATDTIYKNAINVADSNDILWCLPSRRYFLSFTQKKAATNKATIKDIVVSSIIWYNLIDKVATKKGDCWYHVQNVVGGNNRDCLFYTLCTLIVLGLRQMALRYKRSKLGFWFAPNGFSFDNIIYSYLQALFTLLIRRELEGTIMAANIKNYRALYRLSDKGPGIHTIKATDQITSKRSNATTMKYIYSADATLSKYKENGAYPIIASGISSREAAKRIREELGIPISHTTVQKIRKLCGSQYVS